MTGGAATPDQVAAAITQVAREDGGRVVAVLAARLGAVDVADDAVQDALAQAVESWRERGIPEQPRAWLFTAAHNRAIDLLRRASSARRRTLAAAPELVGTAAAGFEGDDAAASGSPLVDDDTGAQVGDERLRLLLLCCHPALDPDTRVALTLRLVGGLTVPEIAAAFLAPEATIAQRIVRAKRKVRDAGIPLSMPARLDERIDGLLAVLYLVFNEGYLSSGGSADDAVRVDLVDEAIRLTRLTCAELPESAEAAGLLALELYAKARIATRVDGAGELVLLDDQDRALWNLELIREANDVLGHAIARMQPGPMQLQARIASLHANARTAADTDWPSIAGAYAQLSAMTGSPVVALNHAVAVAMADGPAVGLSLLDGLAGLDGYHLLHAARGELLLRAKRLALALEALTRARELASSAAEQRHLDRRIGAATDAAARAG